MILPAFIIAFTLLLFAATMRVKPRASRLGELGDRTHDFRRLRLVAGGGRPS